MSVTLAHVWINALCLGVFVVKFRLRRQAGRARV